MDFREWFGNSKVIDDLGNPLVVYHGTYKRFDEFKLGENPQRAADGISHRGFWFGSSVRQVEPYAGRGENRIIIAAYLKIERPYYMDVEDLLEWDDVHGGVKTRMTNAELNEIVENHDGIIFAPASSKIDEEFGLDGEWREPQYFVFDPSNIWRIGNV